VSHRRLAPVVVAAVALLTSGDLGASGARAAGRTSGRHPGRACRAWHPGTRRPGPPSQACALHPRLRVPARSPRAPQRGGPAPRGGTATGIDPATGTAVGVHEHEFRLTLTRGAVRGGAVVVELANEGEDPHNLQIAPNTPGAPAASPSPGLSFPTLAAGQRLTKTITLGPGVWRLWCSLPGHDAAGMHAVLTVVG
jgi:hypothetical protein